MEFDETKKQNNEDTDKRFVTIAKARRILGRISKNYTDDDIESVINILYGMAEVAYEENQDNPSQSE